MDLCLFVPCFPAFFDLLVSFHSLVNRDPEYYGLTSFNIEKDTFSTKNDFFPTHKSQNEYLSSGNLPL